MDLNVHQLGDVPLFDEGLETSCIQDEDCAPGEFCEDFTEFSQCRECRLDTDCPSDLGCDYGFCHLPCESTDSCDAGFRCAGGFCRQPQKADYVIRNAGDTPVSIDTAGIQMKCNTESCDYLDIEWSSDVRPLVVGPGENTVLRANMAFANTGDYRAMFTIPVNDSRHEALNLYLCASAQKNVCNRFDKSCRTIYIGYDCSPECFDNAELKCPGEGSEGPTWEPYLPDPCWNEHFSSGLDLDETTMEGLSCGSINSRSIIEVDADRDGIVDEYDNCPLIANSHQDDLDEDGAGEICDNCPANTNDNQQDMDGDGLGDACDDDLDGDGVTNVKDNCPHNPNPSQSDTDSDSLGDACDEDIDNDDYLNPDDNCPMVSNPKQLDSDPDEYGDACYLDQDEDGVLDFADNCPSLVNPEQTDTDGDGMGDICDTDRDNDGTRNSMDNCELLYNPYQEDSDRDGLGDACDQKFCYVLDQPDKCLDPWSGFEVYAGEEQVARLGNPVPLIFWANRKNQALKYHWTIKDRPLGSFAEPVNPTGTLALSLPFYYPNFRDQTPQFIPDQPGTYVIEIEANLVFLDKTNPGKQASTNTFRLLVSK